MFKKSIFAVLAMTAMAATATAQTTGTIIINGNNPAAVSITNDTDTALSTTVVMGTLTPTTGGTLTPASFPIRLRSSRAYVLSAQATALSFTGLDPANGGATMSAADLGFGITTLTNTGANVAAGRTDTIIPLFNYTGGFPTVTNGLTPFVVGTHGTLGDVSANTQILSGGRISARGNISTNNNYITATLALAALPQYFTANTSFSTTVTLTVTAP
jgi:hypothetical protein